jgi:EAL domain-containing protein (putative c-di-GMP-specific phosphodiesterase class I)
MTSLTHSTLANTVARRVSRFLNTLNDPIKVDGKNVHASASVGIANLCEDGTDALSLLSVAETAMGYARDRGDNGYAFYASEMDTFARQRLTLEDGLRTAIEDGEIFLTYQPKLDLVSGNIVGAEALVRWNHPTRGLVSPVDFIPLAEDSGQIVSIGTWVMRESCLQARKWISAGAAGFRIAVNVSIRQLQEPEFVDTVQKILQETGLETRALVIELTENMIMENAETNVGKLQRLRDIGVGLSIDDFGTGYSSLAYLQRFPLDQLKIDQSFVSEIIDETSEVPIVKAIVSLAHDLGMEVVAEGVETELQLDRLRELKCEEFQGYLISRPVVAEEFEALMASMSPNKHKAA